MDQHENTHTVFQAIDNKHVFVALIDWLIYSIDMNDSLPTLNSSLLPPSQPINYLSQDMPPYNLLIDQQKSCHCRSFVSTLILGAGITIPVLMHLNNANDLSKEAMIGICVGAYLMYLMIGLCFNELYEYLCNIDQGRYFESQYSRVLGLQGHFVMTAECWHYETRYQTRYETDSNGNRRMENYTTEEKVITHSATESHIPRLTRDDSGCISRINAQTSIVFIHFKVNYQFIDENSRAQFQFLCQDFRRRHQCDTFQEYQINYIVPELIQRKAFYVGQLYCNIKAWLIFFSLIGLIWPISMWVESKISRFEIQFIKTIAI